MGLEVREIEDLAAVDLEFVVTAAKRVATGKGAEANSAVADFEFELLVESDLANAV